MSGRTRIVIALLASAVIGLVEALVATWRYQAADPGLSEDGWWLTLAGTWLLASAFNYGLIHWWRMRHDER